MRLPEHHIRHHMANCKLRPKLEQTQEPICLEGLWCGRWNKNACRFEVLGRTDSMPTAATAEPATMPAQLPMLAPVKTTLKQQHQHQHQQRVAPPTTVGSPAATAMSQATADGGAAFARHQTTPGWPVVQTCTSPPTSVAAAHTPPWHWGMRPADTSPLAPAAAAASAAAAVVAAAPATPAASHISSSACPGPADSFDWDQLLDQLLAADHGSHSGNQPQEQLETCHAAAAAPGSAHAGTKRTAPEAGLECAGLCEPACTPWPGDDEDGDLLTELLGSEGSSYDFRFLPSDLRVGF